MRLCVIPTNMYLNIKGRYEALEILLPFVGAKALLTMEEKTEVVSSLLQGIADGDHNCGAIAQLLGKISRMKIVQ